MAGLVLRIYMNQVRIVTMMALTWYLPLVYPWGRK